MSDNEIDFTQLQDNEDPDDDEGASQSVISSSSIADTSSSLGAPPSRQKRKMMGVSRARRKVSMRRRGLAGKDMVSYANYASYRVFSVFRMSHWTARRETEGTRAILANRVARAWK
jgi:hypothetical protein